VKRPRILIADDHALLAEGIAGLLRCEYDVVGISPDGRQVLADAERLQPDIITLDIGMPRLNGLDAALQLRKLIPKARLVFVTQQIDLRYLRAALQAGASAFVAKQSASSELLTAVRKALLGRTYITPLLAGSYAALEEAHPTLDSKPPGDPLTPRQREVLQLIAEGSSTRAISKALNISPKTVEFHKNALMTALGLRTTAELTRYAIAQGIIST
jgi:DNA-binding NarL/FixJ family response regulator